MPQSFETDDTLEARSEWNLMKPRMTRPQNLLTVPRVVYQKGITTNLKPNDPLVVVDAAGHESFQRVEKIDPDADTKRTKVTLHEPEISALEALISTQAVIEEEGPYSVAVGDRAAREMIHSATGLVNELRAQTKPAWELRQDAYILRVDPRQHCPPQ